MKMTHNVPGWGIIPYSTQLHLLGKRQTDRQTRYLNHVLLLPHRL